MDINTITTLTELGIKVTDLQYKYPVIDEMYGFPEGGMETKFVLKGSFYEELDAKRLIEEIVLLRSIARNNNPAVKDLYEQLLTTAGLTKK